MRATVNFTGRKTIFAEHVSAEIHEGTPDRIAIRLNAGFPPVAADEQLVLSVEGHFEARRSVVAGPIETPAHFDVPISGFRDRGAIKVRVLVTRREGGLARILAEADRVSPELPVKLDHGTSFLPLRPVDDLPVPWRLSFQDFRPVLEVCNDSGNAALLLRHPLFRPLVLPAVVTQVFMWISGLDLEMLDEGSVPHWFAFFRGLNVQPVTAADMGPEDTQEFVEQAAAAAAAAFCKKHKFLDAAWVEVLADLES